MNSRTITPFALAAALVGTAAAAAAYPGQQMASQAHVTMAQARAKALKAQPGTITAAELEREGGGSGLRYSFDIKTASGVHEVGIDAKTGALLENSRENPAAENGEKGDGDGD